MLTLLTPLTAGGNGQCENGLDADFRHRDLRKGSTGSTGSTNGRSPAETQIAEGQHQGQQGSTSWRRDTRAIGETDTPRAGDVEVVDKGRRTLEAAGHLTLGDGRRIFVHEFCGFCGAPIGKVSRKRGITYTWLACDHCGQISLVKGLAPDRSRLDEPDYWKDHGRPCRMTPGCRGRHLLGAEEGMIL